MKRTVSLWATMFLLASSAMAMDADRPTTTGPDPLGAYTGDMNEYRVGQTLRPTPPPSSLTSAHRSEARSDRQEQLDLAHALVLSAAEGPHASPSSPASGASIASPHGVSARSSQAARGSTDASAHGFLAGHGRPITTAAKKPRRAASLPATLPSTSLREDEPEELINIAGTYRSKATRAKGDVNAIKITQSEEQLRKGEATIYSFYGEGNAVLLGLWSPSEWQPFWGEWYTNGQVEWKCKYKRDGVPAAQGSFFQLFSKKLDVTTGGPLGYANVIVDGNGNVQDITCYLGPSPFGVPVFQGERVEDNDAMWWIAPKYDQIQILQTADATIDQIRQEMIQSLHETLGDVGEAEIVKATAEFRSIHSYLILELLCLDNKTRHALINVNSTMAGRQAADRQWGGSVLDVRETEAEIIAIMQLDCAIQLVSTFERRPIQELVVADDAAIRESRRVPRLKDAYEAIAQHHCYEYDLLENNCQNLVSQAWEGLFKRCLVLPELREARLFAPGTWNFRPELISSSRALESYPRLLAFARRFRLTDLIGLPPLSNVPVQVHATAGPVQAHTQQALTSFRERTREWNPPAAM